MRGIQIHYARSLRANDGRFGDPARAVESTEASPGRGRVSSWNLCGQHIAGTLQGLMDHPSHRGRPANVVVWAHHSHLGDARTTEVSEQGEWGVGQPVRERFGHEGVLVASGR